MNVVPSEQFTQKMDVCTKITRALTSQTTLFPWQGMTKSVDPVLGIETHLSARLLLMQVPKWMMLGEVGDALRFCCAGCRPLLRKKSLSPSLSLPHNLKLGFVMPSDRFGVAYGIRLSQHYAFCPNCLNIYIFVCLFY